MGLLAHRGRWRRGAESWGRLPVGQALSPANRTVPPSSTQSVI